MSKIINFNDALFIKKEKESLLRNIKLFHDKYINDFLSEDFYPDSSLDEHPNQSDCIYLSNVYDNVNDYLFQTNVDVKVVKKFANKLEQVLIKNENSDDLDLTLILYIFYNLFNVYKDKLLDLDVPDIKFAISVFSGCNNGKPANKLDYCCDAIINKDLFAEIKKYTKDEQSMRVLMYNLNDELDEYPYSGSYENRRALVEKITRNYIENSKDQDASFNDVFIIPVFTPKIFYKKFKTQVQFFIDNNIPPYGYNVTLEDLEYRLYTLVDDLTNIPEENKSECYSNILNIWKSDLPMVLKIKEVFEIVDTYKVVSKRI